MSTTLTYKDVIQRTGHTVIDGVKVCQYNCTISSDDPTQMRVIMAKVDSDLYKQHRSICRADFAEFEDAAYELQAKLLADICEK